MQSRGLKSFGSAGIGRLVLGSGLNLKFIKIMTWRVQTCSHAIMRWRAPRLSKREITQPHPLGFAAYLELVERAARIRSDLGLLGRASAREPDYCARASTIRP